MKQEEEFEVAVAAFEELLSKYHLWEEYLSAFNQRRPGGVSTEIYTDWKEWASITPKHQWCCSAFIWEDTRQKHHIWKNFDYKWLIWICENLNN